MRTRSLRAVLPVLLVIVGVTSLAGIAGAATGTPGKKDIAAATAVLLKSTKLQYSGQYGPAYDLLVPAQQDLMSRDDFIANCAVPFTKKITITKFEPTKARYETVTVPGTDTEEQALAVTISLSATNGKKSQSGSAELLAFRTPTGWTWAMTQDQLDGCGPTAPVG